MPAIARIPPASGPGLFHKRLIGPRLRARNAVTQAGEVALAVQVLNRMIREVKPVIRQAPSERQQT